MGNSPDSWTKVECEFNGVAYQFDVNGSKSDGSFWVLDKGASVPFLVIIIPPRRKIRGGTTEESMTCLCQGSRELQEKTKCRHMEAVKKYRDLSS